ncbi:MAG: hypothetical protein B7Z79_12100 [Thiomonas sp. 20-64-9]|nr:MAG: hypothetical protein B7Z79_12100 [Thiomonas sp. 20-64-9]
MVDTLLHFQAMLLAAVGALAFWLRDLPGLVLSWVRRFFITTLTLDSRDEFLFAALVEYIDLHPALRQVNQCTARSVRQGSARSAGDAKRVRAHPPAALRARFRSTSLTRFTVATGCARGWAAAVPRRRRPAVAPRGAVPKADEPASGGQTTV